MAPATDFILAALAQEGLDHLFMVPGGLVDPFLPALGRAPQVRAIVAAQEGGAAYMADGYARASGRFGAALGIGGPGLCNMATAVAAAKTDASPVLVLSGEVAVALEGLGAFQDASQATLDDTAVMKPLTRLSITVADARNSRPLAAARAHRDVEQSTWAGASVVDAGCADRSMRGKIRAHRGLFPSDDAAQP